MKLLSASLAIALASTTVVNAAPTVASSEVIKREQVDELHSAIAELQNYREKRDQLEGDIAKREYQIVTNILSALNDTGIVPKVLSYAVANQTLQPILINAVVGVLKSGIINLQAVFDVLDKSNLVYDVIEGLISDCTFYESLFKVAETVIGDLLGKVTSGAKREIDLNEVRALMTSETYDFEFEAVDKRDLSDVVVNILGSLADSGLATSVVKAVLNDPNFLSFGAALVKAVVQSGALPLSEIINAIKQSNFVGDLLKQLLTLNNGKTIVTNLFAAYSGKCSSSGYTPSTSSNSTSLGLGLGGLASGLLGGLLGGSGTSPTTTANVVALSTAYVGTPVAAPTSPAATVDPCVKRVKRRVRRRSYNY